jgi:hypothetical protein
MNFRNSFYVSLGVCVAVILLCGIGCEQPPVSLIPDRIHTVAVETFSNKTIRFGLEEELTRDIIDEFIRDGRLSIAEVNRADSLLTGEITRYSLEPVSYDENYIVEAYRISVEVDMKYTDLATDKVLIQEMGTPYAVTYYVTPTAGEMVETEDDAQKRLAGELAQELVNLVLRWR